MPVSERLARLCSSLFHPVLIPTLGIFILFQINSHLSFAISQEARRFIILIIFVNTAIAPVMAMWIMKKTGYVKDFTLANRNERILPLLVTAVLFFMTYYLLRQISLPSLVYFYVMSATLLVMLTLMISFTWKISIHMVSLGGFTGFLVVTSLYLRVDIAWLITLAFVVSGLTGTARLVLNVHNPAQVYAGYLLGLFAMLGLFFYFS